VSGSQHRAALRYADTLTCESKRHYARRYLSALERCSLAEDPADLAERYMERDEMTMPSYMAAQAVRLKIREIVGHIG
jgi:hypothetical protein